MKTSALLASAVAALTLAACQKPVAEAPASPIVINTQPAAADAAPIIVAQAAPGSMADVTPAVDPVPASVPASTPLPAVVAPPPAPLPATDADTAPAPVVMAPQNRPGDLVMGNGGIGPQGSPALQGPDGATTIPTPGTPGVTNDRNSTNRIPDR